ncbi:hypothetical protein H0W26_02170 [Candidatus Dependentiae bacterium]|nr:hypothetical protein [Candidatus Dependentiae bacterium]
MGYKNRKTTYTLKLHEGVVDVLTFSPDGKTALLSVLNKPTRLWDITTGRGQATLKGLKSRLRDVAFSSDGKNCSYSLS